MANRSYNDRTPDGTSDPLKGEDIIGVSNEDGGGGFDLSKKITITQVANFLRSLFGLSIPNDVIAIGNAAGTGIEGSTGKAGGISGDASAFYLSHKDHQTTNGYGYWQGTSGYTQINSNTGLSVIISIANNIKLTAVDNGLILTSAGSSDTVGINNTPTSSVKLKVRGTNDLNSEFTFTTQGDSDVSPTFSVTNDGYTSLEIGTSVNEISDDSDFSSATDDEVRTALAIKDFVEGLVTPQIIGGLVVTSTSTTDVSNGSYNILEDTTALTSVSSGIAQDSDWTIEITEAGITNQKGRVSAVIKCEKTGGAGRQYDFAIFKNGSIISDSEMTDLTLENNDTWSNIKCTAPVELSTGDLFSIRVSGNGTGDDIECTNGTIYIN